MKKRKTLGYVKLDIKDFEKKGKQSTVKSKKEIFATHILHYFRKMKNKRYNAFNY